MEIRAGLTNQTLTEKEKKALLDEDADSDLWEHWDCKPGSFSDFLSNMLRVQPGYRWTAGKLLQHKWLREGHNLKKNNDRAEVEKLGKRQIHQYPKQLRRHQSF